MIVVYGYVAAWGLPCISPYVTKLVTYLRMTGIPFEYKNQDLTKLDVDAPFGKLPYIIDTDDNTKVADSNTIIEYLIKKYNIKTDDHLTAAEKATAVAFDRLATEHLYWSGVIQPRWKQDEGFEIYIPYLVSGAEVGPELRAFLDAFRVRILNGFEGQGMGRRDVDTVLGFYQTDIDALSDFLGDKKYFFGDNPTTVDAGIFAMLQHLTRQPQKWKGTGYLEGKQNLMDYLGRFDKSFKVLANGA